jgi:NAD(P)-dependent dehydrogenase (short-subunit alcohol dehydrogenase family)
MTPAIASTQRTTTPMPVIAIVGAGPGLGLSIARRFGTEGFQVALIARNRDHLDDLTAQLVDQGIDAAGFTGDVTQPDSLAKALTAAAERFGPIDVLEYSPADRAGVNGPATDATSDDLQRQIDYHLHGAVTAVQQVLPAMRARRTGTLLFTTGASSIRPLGGDFDTVGVAMAALRNYALALNVELADQGIHAAHVAIGVFVDSGPGTEADLIAEHYWHAHAKRDQPEIIHTPNGPW